jgi:hypothetical protein
MLADEVRQILRDLLAELGATSVVITRTDEPERTGVPARTLPLGSGDFLRVELGAKSRTEAIDATLERCVRALRAASRRWDETLPEMTLGADTGGVTPQKVRERIATYLGALAAIGQVDNVLLVVKGEVLDSGRPPQALESARWQFILRRVAAAREPGSSHGELADPDFYAVEFWYGAALVLYLRPPYALDFIRFRCRQVTRELAHLLPLLEPEPTMPAAIRPPAE